MNRRELLSKISLFLVAVPVVGACAAEEDRDTRPPGGGGGGGGGDEEPQVFTVANQDASGHSHTFMLSCTDLEDGVSTYTAGGAHTHMVSLTEQQIADILDGNSVTIQTTGGHPHTWIVSMPSGLCG